jgi:glycosyltransferase involved in cell wall biosynthesis
MQSPRNGKRLLVFTYMFPYGPSESFLGPELEILAGKYEQIGLVPLVRSQEAVRKLPANVEVLDGPGAFAKASKKRNFNQLYPIIYLLCYQLIHSSRRSWYLRHLRYQLSDLPHQLNVAQELGSLIAKGGYQAASCYSYWFDYWMLPLTILKWQGKINYLLTRAHGGDVYEYQHLEKGFFFPFRHFQIKQLDRICPVSQDGLDHLQQYYPSSESKLKLSRLGVNNNAGRSAIPAGKPIFVSCSSFMDCKRVHLIPALLDQLGCPVRWIHIGHTGNREEEVRKAAATVSDRVEVNFLGQMPNAEVLKFYSTNPVTAFINVSDSEGLPVSIMEAISFGIPVIATNCGGTREIVTPQTGLLLEVAFTSESAAALIVGHLGQFQDESFREGVAGFWKKEFNAEVNFTNFMNTVLP